MEIKTLCLAALSLGDASGYEIKKMFEEGPFAHFYDAGYGSIYPALNGMLAGGLVTCEEFAQEGRPAKKVYSLTPRGMDVLCEELHTKPAADRVRSDSLVMMYFAQLLTTVHRQEVFDDYLERHRNALAALKEMDLSKASNGRRFVNGLGQAIYGAVVDYFEANQHILFAADSDDAKNTTTARRRTTGKAA